jgi:hypothetical protein
VHRNPLEAAIRVLRLNGRKKNLQDDVDFRKSRSSFRCLADEAGSNKETDDACDGVGESDRRQRKGLSPHARITVTVHLMQPAKKFSALSP